MTEDQRKYIYLNYREFPSQPDYRVAVKVGDDLIEFGYDDDVSAGGWVHVNGELLPHRLTRQGTIYALVFVLDALGCQSNIDRSLFESHSK